MFIIDTNHPECKDKQNIEALEQIMKDYFTEKFAEKILDTVGVEAPKQEQGNGFLYSFLSEPTEQPKEGVVEPLRLVSLIDKVGVIDDKDALKAFDTLIQTVENESSSGFYVRKFPFFGYFFRSNGGGITAYVGVRIFVPCHGEERETQ